MMALVLGLSFSAFAALSQSFSPAIANKRRKFPNPAGRLRIGPDV